MRDVQAVARGYSFTGSFGWDKEEQKERAVKERKDGYKALVVCKPPSPLSRGHHGIGYSVYRKPTEKKLREIEAEKEAIEKKKFDDGLKIIGFLYARTKEELANMFIDAKGDELLGWAKKNNII